MPESGRRIHGPKKVPTEAAGLKAKGKVARIYLSRIGGGTGQYRPSPAHGDRGAADWSGRALKTSFVSKSPQVGQM
jgi:hypothetical protein